MNKKQIEGVRTKIVKLVSAGKVSWAPHVQPAEALKRVKAKDRWTNPIFTHISLAACWKSWRPTARQKKQGFKGDNGGFVVHWGAKDIGGGELTIRLNRQGKLEIDTECTDRDWAKKILCALMDTGTTDRERGEKKK